MLSGETGVGNFTTINAGCAGTIALKRIAEAPKSEPAAKVAALPKQGKLLTPSPFNGRWSITRLGNQECPTPKYEFDIVISEDRVEGSTGIANRGLKGTMAATGTISFSHTNAFGGINRNSGSLKRDSGTGTFKVDRGPCQGTITATRQ